MAVERDDEERKKAILGTSKAHLTQMLRTSGMTASGEPVADINNAHIDRRSQRVRRATVGDYTDSAAQVKVSSSHVQRQGSAHFETMPPSAQRQTAKPPLSQAKEGAPIAPAAVAFKPTSQASVKAESNTSSKRQIRTGGFQKLGQALTTK